MGHQHRGILREWEGGRQDVTKTMNKALKYGVYDMIIKYTGLNENGSFSKQERAFTVYLYCTE